MANTNRATEVYDGRITVQVLHDSKSLEEIVCSTYEDAIEEVKQHSDSSTVTKIEDRDGDIVFTSENMNIFEWEKEWRNAKRRIGVNIESHDCPYDNVSCFADDLCIRCKMDAVQDEFD